MMQSDVINWSGAILLSLLAHGLMFTGSGVRVGAEKARLLQAPLVTRLSFSQPQKNPVAERPVLEKPVLEKLRPVKKQRVRRPEKIEPEIKAKPVQEKVAEKKQTVKDAEAIEKIEPVKQVAALEQVHGKPVSHSSTALLQRERQQYLHKLLSHIESHKFYPRAARRRSIEGDVKVSFMLCGDGHYEKLTIDGGHTALVKAARQALEDSMPLPAPPEDIEVPEKIEFAMVYSLAR
jgi:protein TonB